MLRSYNITERISSSLKDFQYDPAYSGRLNFVKFQYKRSNLFLQRDIFEISSKLFPKTILTVELMSSPEKS